MNKIHIPIEPEEHTAHTITPAQPAAAITKKTVRRWPAAILGILVPLVLGSWYISSPNKDLLGFLLPNTAQQTITITNTEVLPATVSQSLDARIVLHNSTDSTAIVDLGTQCSNECIITIPATGKYTLPSAQYTAGVVYTVNVANRLFTGIILPVSK